MTVYRVALSWGNAAGLVTLSIQPAQPLGLQWPDAVMALDGSTLFQGYPSTSLVWNNVLDPADMDTILSELGLANTLAGAPVPSKKVTAQILDNDGNWIIVNAWATAPNGGKRTMLGWSDVRIELTYIHLVP